MDANLSWILANETFQSTTSLAQGFQSLIPAVRERIQPSELAVGRGQLMLESAVVGIFVNQALADPACLDKWGFRLCPLLSAIQDVTQVPVARAQVAGIVRQARKLLHELLLDCQGPLIGLLCLSAFAQEVIDAAGAFVSKS